jgi:hypothetical protein
MIIEFINNWQDQLLSNFVLAQPSFLSQLAVKSTTKGGNESYSIGLKMPVPQNHERLDKSFMQVADRFKPNPDFLSTNKCREFPSFSKLPRGSYSC